MGSVQRLATVVIVGFVALATVLVLYLADENNRISAEEENQRDDAIERATANFIGLCVQCHGPAGEGFLGPDAKFADGSATGRIGAPLGGNTYATELNQQGLLNGTPWAGATEDGITFPGGFEGRTEWITHRITYGLLNPDGSYRMPAFWDGRGGPLIAAQIDELVTMIQYGDWNKIYNAAIHTDGGYPTPGPNPNAAAAPTAATSPTAEAGGGEAGKTVEIDMVDIAFQPDAIEIPANTPVTIKLINKGAAQHEFKVYDQDIDSGLVDPGATAEVTVNLPPGEYKFHCPVPGHTEAGMVGTLTVK